MEKWDKIWEETDRDIRANRPMIHHITNYVVMNVTANVTLSMGASPVMAHDAREVEGRPVDRRVGQGWRCRRPPHQYIKNAL